MCKKTKKNTTSTTHVLCWVRSRLLEVLVEMIGMIMTISGEVYRMMKWVEYALEKYISQTEAPRQEKEKFALHMPEVEKILQKAHEMVLKCAEVLRSAE